MSSNKEPRNQSQKKIKSYSSPFPAPSFPSFEQYPIPRSYCYECCGSGKAPSRDLKGNTIWIKCINCNGMGNHDW